jgi:hypothetical protein
MSDYYKLALPAYDITFEADRLRREKQELLGELTVRCGLPGALVINGCLSVADFNFSSLRARKERAGHLRERAKTNGDGEPDWFGLLEDFCQRVFTAERSGAPACDLRELPRPERGDDICVEGLTFPKRHPAILFGDGGAAKSYTALYIAGSLAKRGSSIALFDWELCGEDHRERLEMLFGPSMPKVLYCRCERPLTSEVDRLQRVVKDNSVDYAIYDSIAFACDGRPEEAEVASRYFRALREVDCGSLHIAHVNRSEENDKKPFGSSFWHNGARSTWFVQASEQAGDEKTLRLGFFNRKANLGPLRSPVSFIIEFNLDRTVFSRADIAEVPELAGKMSIHQRMAHLLKRGALTPEEIAASIDAELETVKREVRRQKKFIVLDGGRIGLRA